MSKKSITIVLGAILLILGITNPSRESLEAKSRAKRIWSEDELLVVEVGHMEAVNFLIFSYAEVYTIERLEPEQKFFKNPEMCYFGAVGNWFYLHTREKSE